MKNIKLPNKPSGLLRLSVSDCKKVEKMKTRKLNMCTWHIPDMRGCQVCMAGAIMDRTLKMNPKIDAYPHSVTSDNCNKLLAVNCLREGRIRDAAYNHLGLYWKYRHQMCSSAVLSIERLIKDNFNGRLGRAPWNTYLKAADMLEALGL